MFELVVNEFGVQYVGKEHAVHIKENLKEHNQISEY